MNETTMNRTTYTSQIIQNQSQYELRMKKKLDDDRNRVLLQYSTRSNNYPDSIYSPQNFTQMGNYLSPKLFAKNVSNDKSRVKVFGQYASYTKCAKNNEMIMKRLIRDQSNQMIDTQEMTVSSPDQSTPLDLKAS